MKEMRNKQFSPVESAVISLLANALFDVPYPGSVEADLDLVLEEAEKQAVFPYVYRSLSQQDGNRLNPKWKIRFQKHLANNLNVFWQHYLAHELMTEAGIPYTIIKGCASGQYYAVPELRTMGDVDLYVGKDSMEAVRSFLTDKGFAVSNLDHSHHWTFTKDRVEFEVHWLPSGVPAEDDGKIRSRFDDLLEKRTLFQTERGSMYLPDAFHHGLILLLHTANHLSAGGIGLRHLMDWLVFVFSMPEEKFCAQFEDALNQMGLWQFAKVLTAVGVHFFGCAQRAFCKDVSSELAGSILADIFAGGNFGVKDGKRLMESKLLRDEKTREIDGRSGFRHMIRFLNRKAQLALPITEKVPVLLPVGWIKVGIKYRKSGKPISGEPVKLRDLTQSAKEREKLYKQLRLFEE